MSNNNRYIISGSEDKSIKIFDFFTKSEYHHFEAAHLGGVRCVAISSDDKYIITGSEDKSVKVFELETKQQIYHFADAHHGIAQKFLLIFIVQIS